MPPRSSPEAGDYIAAAANGQAGTVLVQFWPHLPESTMPGSIYAGPVSGVMTWRSNQSNGLLRGT